MGLTRPRLGQFQTTTTAFDDELIVLNNSASGTNTNDIGIVFERGDNTNTALIWDESTDTFALISTTEQGSTQGNVTISSYSDLKVNNVTLGGDPTSSLHAASKSYVDTNISSVNSSFTLSADSGTNDTFTTGGTLTFTGGTNITTTVSNDTITIDSSGGASGEQPDGTISSDLTTTVSSGNVTIWYVDSNTNAITLSNDAVWTISSGAVRLVQ
jgi:hypothetical protein